MGETERNTDIPIRPCFCNSPDCPYHDCCDGSENSVTGRTTDGAVRANLSGICPRYAWWAGNKSNELEVNHDR